MRITGRQRRGLPSRWYSRGLLPRRAQMPSHGLLFAILQARAGNIQNSLNAINKAKELIAETGEYFWDADVIMPLLGWDIPRPTESVPESRAPTHGDL